VLPSRKVDGGSTTLLGGPGRGVRVGGTGGGGEGETAAHNNPPPQPKHQEPQKTDDELPSIKESKMGDRRKTKKKNKKGKSKTWENISHSKKK